MIKKQRDKSNYSFYMSISKVEKLEELKWRERKSISELVEEAITEYLINHAEGNRTFSLDKWQENPEFKAIPALLSPMDRWDKYIQECNDDELTKIATANTNVKKMIFDRRTREHKNMQKHMVNTLGRI